MLDYTGERMVPEAADGNTFWEHVQRYRFACSYVSGARVLDIACGEGYGTAALEGAGAATVIGVDASPESCAHARAKYGVDARVGDAERIPLGNSSLDTIVSFETIEHLNRPEGLLNECQRLLAPGGRLIISTPNKPVYHQHSPSNAYHHHEMKLDEFRGSLEARFIDVQLFGQCLPTPRILQLRGVGRLFSWVRRILAPHASRAPTEQERSHVQQCVLRAPGWRDSFDPFAVRSMAPQRLDSACYLIGVATRRDS